jgi:UDP-2-acetamido-3-amino-2,3-dideoxy-glucuronate N-acetyltransferase
LSVANSNASQDLGYFVHESAYVDQPCSIGHGTQIWHFSHIMQDVVIGEKCKIGQNVFIAAGVEIGRNVKIQNNVSVYAGVTLEDDVFCGPSCVFTNINTPRSAFPRNTKEDYLVTWVKQGATIGANATIVCGHTIGRYAFIGAGSTITKDIPDYALVYGNPARQVGWMCECGSKLEDFVNTTVCQACGRKYEYCDENQIKRVE